MSATVSTLGKSRKNIDLFSFFIILSFSTGFNKLCMNKSWCGISWSATFSYIKQPSMLAFNARYNLSS